MAGDSVNLLNGVEPREYQVNIFNDIWFYNSIVVLPTGLGKTVIAAMAASKVLTEKKGNVMFLAPTKPLVDQHYETFKSMLNLKEADITALTGEIDASTRSISWIRSKVIVSTPQVAWNDLRHGLFEIERFALIIFDEVHRAVGNYQYVEIAKKFHELRSRMILGLTASPGSDRKRLEEITRELGIEKIVARSETDSDVRKYVNLVKINVTTIRLPEPVRRVHTILKDVYKEIISDIQKRGELQDRLPSRKDLISESRSLIERAKGGESKLFSLVPYITAAIRVDYALEYLESQGFMIFSDYFNGLLTGDEKSTIRTARIIKKTQVFGALESAMNGIDAEAVENPKLMIALRLCEEALIKNQASRIIIFTHYRKTSDIVVSYLSKQSSLVKPVRFVGQASKEGDVGLSRSEQHAIVEAFRSGKYNTLVATSVAEEGLDIPATDLVVFYEPVPSDIRTIQRRGRTGRSHFGQVHILTFEGSRDIGYLYSARRKESQMRRNIDVIKTTRIEKNTTQTLDDFN